MKIDAESIQAIFSDQREYPKLRNNIKLSDRTYFAPSTSWLTETYHPWYRATLRAMGLGEWKENFDCDDFSLGYHWLANVCHAQTEYGNTQGPAIGEVSYYIAGNGRRPHAINCAFIDEGRLVFIEPQQPVIIKLTPVEKASISFVRF